MRKQRLHRALGLPEGQGEAAFSDAPCTRAQIVTFLWRSYNG